MKIYHCLIIATISFILFTLSCSSGKKHYDQGITGKVMWYEGNFMPTIGDNADRDKPYGVERIIYIFDPLNSDDLNFINNVWVTEIPQKPVKTITSDKNGEFKVSLPAGKYTVLSKEPDGFYANSFDEEKIINPVIVTENQWTNIEVRLDYKAAY